ncbi:GNAT family N-acetyltransferase [Ruminococcus sp. Marseille-P6503]|uniref:GNAT family N-acetyltransferase n=1 Tax=Ruminococcus sp. Marseille-P6503 TaxID=2364796 RepID=UPI000F53BE84|nr:GNAT family N-acetyltransferase [Ruminococcus sp. Marseille-P6503]
MILQTERLILREMTMGDFTDIAAILKDERAMYAYEHGFSDSEVSEWIQRQLDRYEKYGFGLWAVILKESGELIGQCGITMQDAGGREVMEIGYLFNRRFWHNGYACEAAGACRSYAFEKLGAQEICSIIRTNNLPSQRVAIRNGMLPRSIFTKRYMGIDMPHIVFSVTAEELKEKG